MKIYCSACGHPNAYVSKKPNFCQNCGKQMGSTVAATKPQQPPREEAPQDDEEEQYVIPSLDGLDVEIEDNKVRGVKFESIMAAGLSPQEAQDLSLNRPSPKKKRLSKKAQEAQQKQFLEDFKKEAGTNRRAPE